MPTRKIDMSESTIDNDDLTQTQEYIIAGVVIVLFGLLYWFLNHGWNSGQNLDSAGSASPQSSLANIDTSNTALYASTVGAAALTATAVSKPESPPVSIDRDDTAQVDSQVEPEKTEQVEQQQEVVAPAPVEEKEIVEVKTVEKELTQPNEEGEQAAEEIRDQAKAIDKVEAETVYTLPDGTKIDIDPSGFEGNLKTAIINRELFKPIVFDSIYFESGSTKIKAESDHQLKATAALLHHHSDTHILIRGHTDSTGGFSRNAQLSLYRANATALALEVLGIDTRRMRVLGVGAAEPIASNASKEGRSKNRRIEVLITQ